MRTIRITVGLTVTAELSVYDDSLRLGALQQREVAESMGLRLQDALVDAMRHAATRAAEQQGLRVASYTTQAIETE